MTTLHKPVLIESAEQAEKLPAFTVARYIDGDVRAAIKTIDGLWESIPGFYGEEAHFPEDFIGWTALVPIEAEEEWRASWPEDDAHQRCRDERTARLWADQQDAVAMSRLVAPWEPA